jgi:cytochrome d ubiquinol oxidase subunit I
MSGAVITGAFVMAGIGAFYLLTKQFQAHAKTFVRVGVMVGLVAVLFQIMPSGDAQGRMVAEHQPTTLAAMEGLFSTQVGAPIAIIGQPDVQNRRLDNPVQVPRMLSMLTYRRWMSEVKGLDAFPQQDWPDNVALLYYSYHIMVGLGTIFIAIMLLAAWKLWRKKLYESRGMLWVLMLALPFPYIANTAGWMTAEFGRQPWLIYGLMRTEAGISPQVSSGNVWFTLIGFMGMYTVLSLLFLFMVYRVIEKGPGGEVVSA